MTVAVLGATGVIGRALVSALAESEEVLAISRSPDTSPGEGVRAVAADVRDATSVRGSLEGVEVAYYLVHSLGTPDYAVVDRRAAETVAREAEQAGVSQLVYLGGLGDDRPDLSQHLRSRLETAVALSSGAVPVTTLRAAVVIGRGSAAFETIVSLVDRLPAMIAPRWVTTPTQPIALADVVRYLVGVARIPAALGGASTSAVPTCSAIGR